MIYTLLKYTITPLAKVLFRVKIIGKENLPNSGYIMASNHNDNSDPVFLSILTKKQIYFLAWHQLLFPPNKIRFILKHIKTLILIEKGKGKSQPAIDQAVKIIKQGNIFAIFPEGTTQGKDKLLRAHRGVARISLKAKVPVIPIAIIGTAHMYSKGSEILPKRIPRVTVNIGSPLYFKKYYGKHNDRKITKQVADKVMKEIRLLYYQYHYFL